MAIGAQTKGQWGVSSATAAACGASGDRPRARAATAVCAVAALALAALAGSGCASQRTLTDTPRSAAEQVLVSEAIERAVEALAWPELAGRAVAVEVVALAPADAPYLKAAAEARARSLGARVTAPEDAELVLGLRAGAMGTASRRSTFGIPSVPLLVGATPELDFVRVLRQRGYAKLRLVAWDAQGTQLAATPPAFERTRLDIVSVLFLVFHRTNIELDDEGPVTVD